MNQTDGVNLSDLDEFDELVRQKLERSVRIPALRRLFSTLAFNIKLLKQNTFAAVCAEFLKTLASSFCRSKSKFQFKLRDISLAFAIILIIY